MRAVVQRVTRAAVAVEEKVIAQIETGLLVLLGVEQGDTAEDAGYLAKKCAGLRIFDDESGRMNLDVRQAGGELLLVSQFTLLGDARRGTRPSYVKAGAPKEAKAVYEQAVQCFRETGVPIQTGEFQAQMQVSLINDGPVTILLDSRKLF